MRVAMILGRQKLDSSQRFIASATEQESIRRDQGIPEGTEAAESMGRSFLGYD